jgi:RHS repeat-associated protein
MTGNNGLYYMRARYYNPQIKRFINQDVLLGNISEGQSLNRFAYVNGQPVDKVDPFGLSPGDGAYEIESSKSKSLVDDLAYFAKKAGKATLKIFSVDDDREIAELSKRGTKAAKVAETATNLVTTYSVLKQTTPAAMGRQFRLQATEDDMEEVRIIAETVFGKDPNNLSDEDIWNAACITQKGHMITVKKSWNLMKTGAKFVPFWNTATEVLPDLPE